MEKDLPSFAKLMETPFTFALAKGRGRYVCKLKLNRLSRGKTDPSEDFFEDAGDEEPHKGNPGNAGHSEHAVVLYKELAKDLAENRWNGEKDTLKVSESSMNWGAIAADRNSCTGKHCEHKGDCVYFQARKKLADSNVIVANHDLLLASLDAGTLPKIEETLLILDEAHEIPSVASGQFQASLDLSSLKWVDQLGKRFVKVGSTIKYPQTQDGSNAVVALRKALQALQGLVMNLFNPDSESHEQRVRFKHGQLPEALVEPLKTLKARAQTVSEHMNAVSNALRDEMQSAGPNGQLSTMYTALGSMNHHVDESIECVDLLLTHHDRPDAKWAEFKDEGGYIRVRLNASPIVPGDLLITHFWPRVRSAVLTSATLTSCGTFDYFLEEAGLLGDPVVTTERVDSPFNYQEQGELIIAKTKASPKQIDAYNREVAGRMAGDFTEVSHGALALFTSRAHMELVYQALPQALKDMVLVQGSTSKAALLREHRMRVDNDQPSIILGLQSFGQGVDLPGNYCNTLFIAKLPFTPPTDPVDEAKSEWMESTRRDPFNELSVPATGVRLAQWLGRLIRTETDHGTVICYDKRLHETSYGKRILRSMPAFKLTISG